MAFPNPDTQFKPGESGNPKGMAKGTRWLKTRLREALEKGDVADDIMLALIAKAKKGDTSAIKEIFDRIDGKVTQEIDQKTTLTDDRMDLSKFTDDELRQLEVLQRKGRISEEESI